MVVDVVGQQLGRIGRWWEQQLKPRAQAFVDALLEGSADVSEDVVGTVLRLGAMMPQERAQSLRELLLLEPMELLPLVEHMSVLLKFLLDDLPEVKSGCLQLLGRLLRYQSNITPSACPQSNLTGEHFLVPFLALANDRDPQVRQAALGALGPHCLGPEDEESRLSEMAVKRYSDQNAAVRLAAIRLLGCLEVAEIMKHIVCLNKSLGDADSFVVLDALAIVDKLEVSDRTQCMVPLQKLLVDEDVRVKARAVRTVVALNTEALIDCGSSLADCLGDPSPEVRQIVANALHHLEPALIPRWSSRLIRWIKSKDEVVRRAIMEAIMRHPAQLLHVRSDLGDTALHIAARAGDLESCTQLVGLGALIKTKNRLGETPEAAARKAHHLQLFRYFSRLENLTTTRGGLGDAVKAAMEDKRPITRVEWHMIPLPGIAGYFGGFHSLLAVTVGNSKESIHTYVIEKAALIRGAVQDDPEQFKNGVHVSHWVDVLPNVESDALYTLGAKDITNDTGFEQFTMRTLRQMAVDIGPYEVGTCNCHHAALLVYNACAKERAKVSGIPNAFLTNMAWGLRGIGLDVTNSGGSGSVHSQSVSGPSHSVSHSAQSTSIGSVSAAARAQQSNLHNPDIAEELELVSQGEFEKEYVTPADASRGLSFGQRRSSKESKGFTGTKRRILKRWGSCLPCAPSGILAMMSAKPVVDTKPAGVDTCS